jgi:type II secretory pathway component PulL
LIRLKPGDKVQLHLVRINGALTEVFTDLQQAEQYMRDNRKNGQFWRIAPVVTQPHLGAVHDCNSQQANL